MKALIMACLDRETPEYLQVAGKLYMADLYKRVFKSDTPLTLKDHIKKMQDLDYYRTWNYTEEEINIIDSYLDHKSDFNTSYTSIKQFETKYFVKDVSLGQTYETPQFLYARIAMTILEKEENRLEKIKEYLALLRSKKLSLPSPNWEYIGTKKGMATSCCLYTCEDTSASITALNLITDIMNTQSAGLGYNMQIRTKGDGARNNRLEHNGKIPYLTAQQALAKSNKQGSRGGAITQYFTYFDPEVKALIKARNPTTLIDERVDQIDHAILHNSFLAELTAKGEDLCLFSIKDVPDLYKAFYNKDPIVFRTLYAKYSKTSFVKSRVKAREVSLLFNSEAYETGRLYDINIEEANRHTPSQEPIHSSNLCVAPETTLLTINGHQVISELEGQAVTIWNGFEWADTVVVKTGTNQKLLTVKTTNGADVTATLYHKWYVQDGYYKTIEKRTHELKAGDKLVKFNLPVIQGEKQLNNAYLSGFYTADGYLSVRGEQRLGLFGQKIGIILENFSNKIQRYCKKRDGIEVVFNERLLDKYQIPTAEYTVQARLDWLAGILDGDGTVMKGSLGVTPTVHLTSVKKDFLLNLQLMLQTLGVSSLIAMQGVGRRKGKINDIEFESSQAYYLSISGTDVYKLKQLGFKTYRLDITGDEPKYSSASYNTVKEVIDEGRVDDTYCVNEPLRHMAVFNGILTGQCTEILESTAAFHSVRELFQRYSSEYIYVDTLEQRDQIVLKEFNTPVKLLNSDLLKLPRHLTEGDVFEFEDKVFTVKNITRKNEIALCNIAAINLNGDFTDEQYFKTAYYALLTILWVIENSEYPFENLEYTSKARRNAAVGLTGLAYELARNNLYYSSASGKKHMHSIAERHFYMLCKAGIQLAKEKGVPTWFDRSNYSKGWLPIDTYNKNVDTIADFTYEYDWEELRKELLKYGLAFSFLVAHMPCESSSQVLENTNGLYPCRDLVVIKGDGAHKNIFIVPEYHKLKDQYEIAWEVGYNHMIDCYAIFQKWADQGISADFYEDFTSPWQEPLTDKLVLTRYLRKVKMGVKGTYYTNSKTRKTNESSTQEVGCGSGGCSL